jgi:hypothetical protein
MISVLLSHIFDGKIVHDEGKAIGRVVCSQSPGVWRAG